MLRLAYSSHLKLVASEVRARPAFPPAGTTSLFDRTLPNGFVSGHAPERRRLKVVDGSGQRSALGRLPRDRNGVMPGRNRRTGPRGAVAGAATQAHLTVLSGGDVA